MQCHHCTAPMQAEWYFCPKCGVSIRNGAGRSLTSLTDQEIGAIFRKLSSQQPDQPSPGATNAGQPSDLTASPDPTLNSQESPPSSLLEQIFNQSQPSKNGFALKAASLELAELGKAIGLMIQNGPYTAEQLAGPRADLERIGKAIEALSIRVRALETQSAQSAANAELSRDMEREMNRVRQEFKPPDFKGPHHIT